MYSCRSPKKAMPKSGAFDSVLLVPHLASRVQFFPFWNDVHRRTLLIGFILWCPERRRHRFGYLHPANSRTHIHAGHFVFDGQWRRRRSGQSHGTKSVAAQFAIFLQRFERWASGVHSLYARGARPILLFKIFFWKNVVLRSLSQSARKYAAKRIFLRIIWTWPAEFRHRATRKISFRSPNDLTLSSWRWKVGWKNCKGYVPILIWKKIFLNLCTSVSEIWLSNLVV